jgi:hypothetical protein
LDQPVQLGSELVAAPGQHEPTIEIWKRTQENELRLSVVKQSEIPRGSPVEKPSEWSKLLAQSYMRYLCNEHKAASAELVRHSRELVMPVDLYMPRKQAFNELTSHFGEYRREQ